MIFPPGGFIELPHDQPVPPAVGVTVEYAPAGQAAANIYREWPREATLRQIYDDAVRAFAVDDPQVVLAYANHAVGNLDLSLAGCFGVANAARFSLADQQAVEP
jgi:hypothetical protein